MITPLCKHSKLGFWCGVVFGPVFFLFTTVAIILNPWFDVRVHALSDLGATTVPTGWVFNLGLAISGILGAIFSFTFLRKVDSYSAVFSYGIMISSLLFVVVGLVPEDVEIYVAGYTLHKLSALLAYFISSATVIAYGSYWMFKKRWILESAVVLFLMTVAQPLVVYFTYPNLAIPEITFGLFLMVWIYISIYRYCQESIADEDNAHPA